MYETKDDICSLVVFTILHFVTQDKDLTIEVDLKFRQDVGPALPQRM
jgi:hypothetical protein